MNTVIIIGLIISLLFTELTGYSPGGIIVPAYFALAIDKPERMLSTLVAAFLCLGIVRLLSSGMILYGRRKSSVYLMTGILIKAVFSILPISGDALFLTISIGYLVPGLLAKDMERQGIVQTLLSLLTVTLLIHLVQVFFTTGWLL